MLSVLAGDQPAPDPSAAVRQLIEGMVFARRPYVLVVLVRGIEDRNKSAALIAQISKALYINQNK